MQYRCAGFIQAEIEQYAEELEGDRSMEDVESNNRDSSLDSSEDENDESNLKPDKNRNKKPADGQGSPSYALFSFPTDVVFSR